METFHLATKIVFGPGSVDQLGEEAKQLGRKAIIATYPDIRRVGLLNRVLEDLKAKGVDTLVFEEVEPNPRSSTVDRGARIARSEKVDLIIGLGGGSAMDIAKGIALASIGTEPFWHYMGPPPIEPSAIKGPLRPMIQVPTMAGTGAEVSSWAVITNWETHEKGAIDMPFFLPNVAIVDPAVTLTVPKKQTAAGGVDIFCHLAEMYLTNETALPVNDGIREAVMRAVVKYLPQVLARLDDIEARTQLSWASTIAMSQLAELGGSAGGVMGCHYIAEVVGGFSDITHGVSLAALFPAWMRYILPVRKERVDLLGKNVFGKADGVLAVEEWLEEVGMKIRLRDTGCKLEVAKEIADTVLRIEPSEGLRMHPRTLGAKAIEQIYRDSY